MDYFFSIRGNKKSTWLCSDPFFFQKAGFPGCFWQVGGHPLIGVAGNDPLVCFWHILPS
jgi:hypothetical protein